MNAAYEPVITLTVLGPSGQSAEIEAVVDTGFNGFLTLPSESVATLELLRLADGSVTLADGSTAMFDVYRTFVLWDGRPRRVDAHMSDSVPLVGMQLLDRHSLFIEVEDGGRVLIQAGG
ncbi:MAG: clan AA aspartic protease [bacterium]|nr:clan AA aspartic protease [bacterium]